MESRIFRDFGGEKSIVYRDLKMGKIYSQKVVTVFHAVV